MVSVVAFRGDSDADFGIDLFHVRTMFASELVEQALTYNAIMRRVKESSFNLAELPILVYASLC